jgi:CHAT domain-containing protein/Flp pilus assembly protein TadD
MPLFSIGLCCFLYSHITVSAFMKQKTFLLIITLFFLPAIISAQTRAVEEYYKQGLEYLNQENYAGAIGAFYTAKEIMMDKESPDFAIATGNLGIAYGKMGRYDHAEKYLLEALIIQERVRGKDHPDYVSFVNNLGRLYIEMGRYANAEKHLLEAIAISERARGKDHPDYAYSANNLGSLYVEIGNYSQAEKYYLDALNIRERTLVKDHSNYATSANNLGQLYVVMGNYSQAEKYYNEALNIRERILGKDHPDYALSVNNLGKLYNHIGNYKQAEMYFLESLGTIERVLGKLHPRYAVAANNLGGLYGQMGNYAQAEKYSFEALNIIERGHGTDHPDYVSSLRNLYSTYAHSKDFNKALLIKTEENRLSTKIINHNFSFFSERQRNEYWNTNASFFEKTYSLSHFHPVPASNILSYDNAIFSKGLLLRTTNTVRDSIYSSGNPNLISQYEELGILRQQISAIRQSGGNFANIQNLEAKADALDKALTQSSAAFREFQASLNTNWQVIRDSLRTNEAAIEFVSFQLYDKAWTKKNLYAALIIIPGGNAPEWVPLCEETTLTGILQKAAAGNPLDQTQNLYDKYGAELYKTIWQPLEKTLAGVSAVYYSPSGLLHKIAFVTIPVNDNTRLIDRYDLRLVSSTREVLALKNSSEMVVMQTAAVYGGIFYDVNEGDMRLAAEGYNVKEMAHVRGLTMAAAVNVSGGQGRQWAYLPGTAEESRNIHGILTQNNVKAVLLSGNDGNEESFKALGGKNTAVIHLATHGFFLEDIERDYQNRELLERLGGGQRALENPLLRSGIIMAGANNAWVGKPVSGIEDGILFSEEVANLNLVGADLVVLSACETGLGTVNNAEGVFGLQRAFKLAGANSILMSLWEVDDDATAILMSAFYQHWVSGKNKQDAFKESQRVLRSNTKFTSPFYWAAFVMVD